ncbi:MAG: VOC family protein [Saprospiraceae bacterium]|nr:VOC family protein [Saprospiraceae bacterium]MCB9342571.1 VOC family protein [Lewinellaceae bacterium]
MKKRFLGLRTFVVAAPDLEKAKAWYSEALGIDPYFDEPFYVGFNVGGFEFGLDPDSTVREGRSGDKTYWGVENVEEVYAHLISLGATPGDKIMDVGEGIKVGSVIDPFGNPLGLIENPHFKLG